MGISRFPNGAPVASMEITWALLLATVLGLGWLLNLLSLPGNWLSVGATIVYAMLISPSSRLGIGWMVIVLILGLAIFGEVIEFAAGAAGAKKAGGSRRATWLALAGGIVGALVGVFAGALIPIPLVGSMIGAVLFAGLGSLAGAVLGETWAGHEADHSWRVGKAAFWGRLLGTLGKIVVGAVIVAVVLVALVF